MELEKVNADDIAILDVENEILLKAHVYVCLECDFNIYVPIPEYEVVSPVCPWCAKKEIERLQRVATEQRDALLVADKQKTPKPESLWGDTIEAAMLRAAMTQIEHLKTHLSDHVRWHTKGGNHPDEKELPELGEN